MSFEIETNARFVCPECDIVIEHNYTQEDVMNNETLEFTCQNCGKGFTQSTSSIIEAAKEAVLAEFKKNFRTK